MLNNPKREGWVESFLRGSKRHVERHEGYLCVPKFSSGNKHKFIIFYVNETLVNHRQKDNLGEVKTETLRKHSFAKRDVQYTNVSEQLSLFFKLKAPIPQSSSIGVCEQTERHSSYLGDFPDQVAIITTGIRVDP